MIRFLYSTLAYLAANAVGLLLAIVLLPGFTINFAAFIVAVLIFSAVQVVAGPLLVKLSTRYFPQIIGGIALVTVFFGLLITEIVMEGMQMGGIANWLAATLLVWIGSLVASLVLPLILAKVVTDDAKARRDAVEDATAKAEAAAARAERAARAANASDD